MNWQDIGFLLSKNKYNENSLICDIFTQKHGKVVGIVFGGTSKKIKNYLQVGNELHINYNAKSENKIGYFKLEIVNPYSPFFFDNYQKLACINSTMNLIKILTADLQSNFKVYQLIVKFFEIIKCDNWLKDYILWELELLKVIGYDLELKKLVTREVINDESKYMTKSKLNKRIIPDFLIDKEIVVNDIKILLVGLNLVNDYLEKTIFKPNNINFPIKRTQFINTLK